MPLSGGYIGRPDYLHQIGLTAAWLRALDSGLRDLALAWPGGSDWSPAARLRLIDRDVAEAAEAGIDTGLLRWIPEARFDWSGARALDMPYRLGVVYGLEEMTRGGEALRRRWGERLAPLGLHAFVVAGGGLRWRGLLQLLEQRLGSDRPSIEAAVQGAQDSLACMIELTRRSRQQLAVTV